MGELVASKRGGGYFTSYIRQRIARNMNFVASCTGGTGTGKSWSMLSLAEQLDPDFDAGNICFSPVQLMDLINGKTKQLKKGSVILYDEFQVSMGHLDYQSIQSKMLNYLLQTFRHRNFILLLTTPHFNFVNKSARQLFHSRLETVSIDKTNSQVIIKPLLLQVNQSSGKVYSKYLRVATGEGVVPLKRLRISKPSQELVQAYEYKKTAFTTELNKKISEELNQIDKPRKRKLTDKQEDLVKEVLSGKTLPQIAEKKGQNLRGLYTQIELLEKKGVVFKPLKEGVRIVGYEVEGYESS